ncbi:MAG: dockerin type I repeat-containing protein [Planctomycetota bacterium]
MIRKTRVLSVLVSALLFSAAEAEAQCLAVISTGYDEEAEAVLAEGALDDDWTVDDGSGPIPAYTGGAGTGFPIPPWVPNDEDSLWIAPTPNSNAPPGRYTYEIRFEIEASLGDPKTMVLVGSVAADDGGVDLLVNGLSAGVSFGGFTSFQDLPRGTGYGLFVEGENVVQFVVDNGGTVLNPAGLRVDACVMPGNAELRPYDLSTGLDRTALVTLPSGAPDPAYTVSGPGIAARPSVVVEDDPPPVITWLPTSVQSKWIGLAADGEGPAGEYVYRIEVNLPAGFPASDAVLLGGIAADDQVIDVRVNGTSTGIGSLGFTQLTRFGLNAARGLFATGRNAVEFVVVNAEAGPTGLRVDAQVAQGPPLVEGPPTLYVLDSGFDEEAGQLIPNSSPDDNWVLLGPAGSGIAQFATVVPDDAWPIAPAGPWVATTPQSKWIGTSQPTSNGPAGVFTFRIRVEIPDGVDASALRIVGSWISDNQARDIVVNGVSTGISGSGNFVALEPFPDGAGLGLFQNGVNVVDFLVENAPPDGNPVGLRVEAVVGTGALDPADLSTGLGRRGTGLLPAGGEEARYVVTGPAGSGIGPKPAVAVAEDGFPIPPWAANSSKSRWVGLDGADSAGPAGTYVYEIEFELPPHYNAYRTAIAGTWAAAGRGADVLLNGVSIGATAAGPETLVSFPEGAGAGLFVPGKNVLRFVVENPAEGPTGLRVEAALALRVRPDPLDISTGFDEETGTAIDDGAEDPDYVVEDPFAVEQVAVVVPDTLAAVPTWLKNSAASKWIGPAGAVSASPGFYLYQREIVLDALQAAQAKIAGFWAVDDTAVSVRLNDQVLPIPPAAGFTGPTYFPPDAGLGYFREGVNVLSFEIQNGGAAGNPTGLRIDAAIVAGEGGGQQFRRADANADGSVNITDGIFVLNYLFLGGPAPPCVEAADPNDDGSVNITDGIYILNFLFLGGPAPSPPQEDCGLDPPGSPDLGCESFPPC